MKMNDQRELGWIGIGLYTISEAREMTHVPSATIRRWIKGYKYRRVDGFAEAPSVWRAELLLDGQRPALTFLDLLDIRVVDSFRKHGVRGLSSGRPHGSPATCSDRTILSPREGSGLTASGYSLTWNAAAIVGCSM